MDAAYPYTADESDQNAEICGDTYDHDLRVMDERDGMRVYECRECGAEIDEADDDGYPSEDL